MNEELLKILENCNKNLIDAETAQVQVLDLFSVSNRDFFCNNSLLINAKGKCENQCEKCMVSENTPYTDTDGHDGSCC